LLLHTPRGIVEEIEQVDPENPALLSLKYTIEQKSTELHAMAPWTNGAHPL
jgi:hypothetical protein